MKKASVILLVFIYAAASTGVAVKADYCCGILQELKLVLAAEANNKEGCCKVKYQTFKVNDSHAAANVISTPALPVSFVHTINPSLVFSTLLYETKNHVESIHAPPLIPAEPAYISNCIFRI